MIWGYVDEHTRLSSCPHDAYFLFSEADSKEVNKSDPQTLSAPFTITITLPSAIVF